MVGTQTSLVGTVATLQVSLEKLGSNSETLANIIEYPQRDFEIIKWTSQGLLDT